LHPAWNYFCVLVGTLYGTFVMISRSLWQPYLPVVYPTVFQRRLKSSAIPRPKKLSVYLFRHRPCIFSPAPPGTTVFEP